MSFTQKIIQVTITPGGGGTGGSSVPAGTSALGGPLSLQNLRMSCHVQYVGDKAMAEMTLLIWGMQLAHMNAISTLGYTTQKPSPDSVDVYAGDATSGMSHVYKGTIFQAISDFQGAADVPMRIVCLAGSQESATNIQPTSINNKSADVANMMSTLAGQMGLQFENNNVNVKIAYPYLHGSARTQARELADHANIAWVIDRGTLAIWPRNGQRQGSTLISPQTGMVGYPAAAAVGVKLKTLYNPNIKFGATVQVQSSVTPANGQWQVLKLHHDLECFKPSGEWFTTIECGKLGGGGVAT